MSRALLLVLDSFGIGGAPDAAAYGDEGANTFEHIRTACAAGLADVEELRAGALHLPHMESLGLAHAAALACAHELPDTITSGFFAAATETSKGKDTPSGHWELAGLPVDFDWGYLPQSEPSFPTSFTHALMRQANIPGILADKHAAGIPVIEEFGEEHIRTGKPIIYTSVDSVIQIAAHEEHFGLERLYEVCRIARLLADDLRIGRVIARPFIGETRDTFVRTANRKDFATPPPAPTLLDRLTAAGRKVHAIGKIADIFAQRGISTVRKAPDNMRMFEALLDAMAEAGDGDLVFANFVDFDTNFGHRRDVAGYAAALEAFDARLPQALSLMRDGDLLMITADHGCDPTWQGTDHTRERVPVLGSGPSFVPGSVGVRPSFADVGETIAQHLGIAPGQHGNSFLDLIKRDA